MSIRAFFFRFNTRAVLFGLAILPIASYSTVNAQITAADSSSVKPKNKFGLKVFRDSLDGQLDMSSFLIDFHGFIPIPQLITQPALGHIGIMFTPVFIQPNKHPVKGKYTPPDITAAFIGITANKTWGFGAIRTASLPKQHLKYRVGAAYGDVNMDFYRTLPVLGEQEFAFNFHMSAIFGVLLRQIGETDLYAGLEYIYLHNKVYPQFESETFPDFAQQLDLSNNISSVGVNIDFDKRDNVFTPDKGLYITSDFRTSAPWIGSDYNFHNFHFGAFQYFQTTHHWVSGFRFETLLQFGDAPFYLMPSVALRGVPMARYQGNQTYVIETEQRYDFSLRWSALVFGGLAKAPTKEIDFSEAKLVHNYGTGFRYLIARKFKLRTGIDVAWSNEDFGWYIVFGSMWNDRN